jgi:hypothetical protein
MKAEIDERGNLKIEAETPLECYALERWVNQNFDCGKTERMEFDWSYPKVELTYTSIDEYGTPH